MKPNRYLVRLHLTAALLFGGVPVPASAEPATAAAADRLLAIRIDNFGKINASYYRGDQP